MKYKDFKMLSKDDMKQIMGGSEGGGGGCAGQGYAHARVVCNDTFVLDSPNWCANSSNLCNAHGGANSCYCFN